MSADSRPERFVLALFGDAAASVRLRAWSIYKPLLLDLLERLIRLPERIAHAAAPMPMPNTPTVKSPAEIATAVQFVIC
jgi:hypothetical protein